MNKQTISTIPLLGFLRDIIETVIIAGIIFFILNLFIIQPHRIKGASMETNFHDGELILTQKISYLFGKPEFGDVVVFKAPKAPKFDFIKRIVGLPGQKVMISNGVIYVDGKEKDLSKYSTKPAQTIQNGFVQDGREFVVPADEYSVLGDNRDHSSDSRDWGFVKDDEISGKAWIVYWPLFKNEPFGGIRVVK